MRLKYQVVKELCQSMTNARLKIRDTKDILENLKKVKWFSKKHHLTLEDYQYQLTDFCNAPNTILLDEVIDKLNELIKSNSNIVDYAELESDMEWLKEYYEEESWNDVARWLTNIDSTLRETFSCYMDALKEVRGNNNFKTNKD